MSATVQLVDCETWRRLTAGFRDYNYRQVWEFGVACAARVGARSEHVAVHENGDLAGLADVRVKSLPVIGSGIAYINGGPLVRRGEACDTERLRAVLSALGAEYVDRRGLVLRIAPPPGPVEHTAAFTASGYVPSDRLPAYRTILLPIDRPLEDVRGGLSQKWRNNLKRAEAETVEVRSALDAQACATFADLYDRFRDATHFDVALDARFYAQRQMELPPDERFHLSLAYANGELIAGHLCSILGDTAVVLLRAGTAAAREHRAAYLLQWYALGVAQQRGCRWYDLGGIDPEGNPGVYAFKAGLGGVDVTAPGPFECRPTRLAGAVVGAAERAYRGLRALRRRVGRLT